MATVFTLNAGEAFVQVAAIEIPVNHLLYISPPEAVLPGEMFVIEQDKGFKIVLYAVGGTASSLPSICRSPP